MSKIPTPYSRPSVDLSPVQRRWSTVAVDTLVEGDTVSDVGLLAEVLPSGGMIKLTGIHGNVHYFSSDSKLRAFVVR